MLSVNRLNGILDGGDSQPPYVEVFSHHPLMFMSLCNHRLACTQATPRELLFWSHGVQCRIDEVASNVGLHKVKMMGNQGPSCMFVSSPDMPPKQQADAMFTAAKELRALLSTVALPGGETLNCQITIHAGTYAGGVVGKNSWTYDIFGSDVQDLLDMDRFNTANSILVSESALKLLGDAQQFAPACKLVCSGQEVVLHQLVDQASSRWGSDSPTAAALKAPPALCQPADEPAHPVKHHTAAAAQHASDGDAQQDTRLPRQPFRSRSSSLSSLMRRDLRFRDSNAEDCYLSSQLEQQARMDMLFVAAMLCLMAWIAYSGSYSGQLLLASCGQWVVPVTAATWFAVHPSSYYTRREVLWVVHRVLAAVHLAGLLLLCTLQQQKLADVAGAAEAAVSSSVAAQGAIGVHGVANMLRRGAVLMLIDNLGFKVRWRAHLCTVGLTAAVTVMGIIWQCSNSSIDEQGSFVSLWLWELLLRLSVSCLAPTVLLYWWELDDRRMFVTDRQGLSLTGESYAALHDDCGALRKAKVL